MENLKRPVSRHVATVVAARVGDRHLVSASEGRILVPIWFAVLATEELRYWASNPQKKLDWDGAWALVASCGWIDQAGYIAESYGVEALETWMNEWLGSFGVRVTVPRELCCLAAVA